MQADAKVKLVRDCLPVTRECAYLDTGSVGPVSTIYAKALARATDEDLNMGRALARRFERIDEMKTRVRSEVASLLGADPAEIELTRSTRDGIVSLLGRMPWSPGDEVVTTQLEFPACADAIHSLTQAAGVIVRVAEVPGDSREDIDWLERCLTPRTRLIVLSGVAYATGHRLPLDRIAELAAARGVRTLIDGAQLAGAAALNLRSTPIDFLAMPLQKWLLGPEGLGVLYLRTGALSNAGSDGAAQGWPVLQACAEHLAWMRENLGWDWIHQRTTRLGTHARSALGDIDGLSLVTPETHAGLVAIRCDRDNSQELADHLQSRNMIVRHRPELNLLRISTAFFNTEDEIDQFARAIRSRDGQSKRKDAGLRRMLSSTSLLPDQHVPGHDLGMDYRRVRQISIDLTAALDPEDCVVQTIPEVSPTKWHLAHTSWFFEQFCLIAHAASYQPCDERFLYLFNSYYHSVGKMHARPQRGFLNRPLLSQVLDYRRRIDEAMLTLIDNNRTNDELAFVVTLGLHHEQQHQELMLTDIKHVFYTNPLQPAYSAGPAARSAPSEPMRYVGMSGGRFQIGHAGPGFSFDNETPRHDVLVDEHELGDRLVSNAEYREFIDSGGYRDSRLWMSDGFAHAGSAGWNRPLYWSEDLETEYTLSGWRPIDPAAPVCHVSQYEADAFARWAGARLPCESEWELAAAGSAVEGNTLDRGLLHPAGPQATGALPLRQLWGDVWEWTASPYTAYPGFKPLSGSLGEYNGKFMSNQIVVRGGSCVTWAEHLRASYRSFFYPHDRWQFLGFRLARNV